MASKLSATSCILTVCPHCWRHTVAEVPRPAGSLLEADALKARPCQLALNCIAAPLYMKALQRCDCLFRTQQILSAALVAGALQDPKVTADRAFNGFGTNFDNSPEPIYGNVFLPRKFKVAITVPGRFSCLPHKSCCLCTYHPPRQSCCIPAGCHALCLSPCFCGLVMSHSAAGEHPCASPAAEFCQQDELFRGLQHTYTT